MHGRQNLRQYRGKCSRRQIQKSMPTADTEGVTDAGGNLYRTAGKVAQRPWHSTPDGRIQSASHQMSTDRPIERAHDGVRVSHPPQKSSRVFGKKLPITNVVYAYTRSRDTASVHILANCRLRVVTDYHTGDSAMNNSGGNNARHMGGRAIRDSGGPSPSSFFLYL